MALAGGDCGGTGRMLSLFSWGSVVLWGKVSGAGLFMLHPEARIMMPAHKSKVTRYFGLFDKFFNSIKPFFKGEIFNGQPRFMQRAYILRRVTG